MSRSQTYKQIIADSTLAAVSTVNYRDINFDLDGKVKVAHLRIIMIKTIFINPH